jgi:hypothetical protein
MNPGRLCCGEIFNGILKESTIEKGMLKKFAINELSFRKLGQSYYGSGPNSWENPVMNSVEEVILVHEYRPTSDSMTCARTSEEDFNMMRHKRIDWKAPVITQATLWDILKKDKKDGAKKEAI